MNNHAIKLDSNSINPFIPRWLRTQLAKHLAKISPGSSLACQAAILFADLSGFTALTEALTRTGAEGVEELDRLLNTVFTELIDTIHTHGGDVVRFGGDALTVLFQVESTGPHRTLDIARRHALANAFAMQNVMQDFQSVQTHAGTFSLRLKISIAAGKTQMQIVGSPEVGLDLVAQSGGWMNVDVADKGSVLIVLFSAPVALGDEPSRALSCALALLKDKRTNRIGVSSGQVFADTLGSAERQAYTVLGSEMNLADRLMVRARRSFHSRRRN